MNRTSKVTVVPADNMIMVDGVGLNTPILNAPANMHALQWTGNEGHIEWTDKANTPLTASDFTQWVAPFALAYDNAFNSLQELSTTQTVQLPTVKTVEELEVMFNQARKERLSDTDYIFMEDYPDIMPSLKEAVIKYRQELRDMPSLSGYPWDGGESKTPWPVNPLAGN